MPHGPSVDEYPLTPVQQGMLFHWLQETNVGVDIEQMVGDLHEEIDVATMDAAWLRTLGQYLVGDIEAPAPHWEAAVTNLRPAFEQLNLGAQNWIKGYVVADKEVA